MDNKPIKGEYLEALLRSSKTVFTTEDVVLLWGEDNRNAVSIRLKKYVREGKLVRIRRGLYAKDEKFDRFEMATRIYTPSYISFETILTRTGVNFQHYGNIFVASYLTRDIEAGGQKISFVRMKDYVLSDPAGIEYPGGVATATKERAFLDRIYVTKDYHFDNLGALDWDKVFAILPIYRNQRMDKTVRGFFDHLRSTKV
ncbi:MAG TPA: type IV toxin-antitoxin system AbiEi family antitoxin domain-containing protein [Candidatus Peribacteraceae bacterium]|nr:type IV toxin-antitoxin system AbiEi family antitoxin domain-containing protein [Candidatus Peribacteraceae bacterium]